jgi:hypothetical protein
MRAATVGAIVLLVGLGLAMPGGTWLVVIAVVLAYLLGAADESARRNRRRGGYVLPPYRQSVLTEFEKARGDG